MSDIDEYMPAAREIAAQCWCDEKTSNRVMDVDLAEAFATRIAELMHNLETERMRLAACGTAALGYFDGCLDEYKSASLDDVLRLRHQLATTERLLAESQAREDMKNAAIAELAVLARHKDECSWATPLPTGIGVWGCDCGLDRLVLDGEPTDYIMISDSTALDAAITKAKREENEACEGICNRFAGREMHPAECAAAIRMRRMADELKGGEQ